MMMDIFSGFDSLNFTMMQLTQILWVLSLWVILIQNTVYWIFSSWSLILIFPKKTMWEQSERSYGSSFTAFSLTVNSLFCFLILINMAGLFPYVFSPTVHLMLTLSLSMTFWVSFIYLGIKQNFSKFAAHLLPVGAPFYLNPFLSVIELVSLMVRPLTLAIRLAANIGAGHIILGLLGVYMSSFIFSSWTFFLIALIHTGYFLFEFGVGLIQAYIFSLLITLYSDDLACYLPNSNMMPASWNQT
uniref:ATP synthase subunit a n=1 Tax=Falcidens acutargatus TaxID=2079778 RepID=A0A343X862_9MOLL|nr:ATP synthase F0 subunit 6 [Falcidens acutargatus]AWH02121.1 ATP synthase F0 subunit 6 [Falcidens acutargatus]